jgi:hypothetical protein
MDPEPAHHDCTQHHRAFKVFGGSNFNDGRELPKLHATSLYGQPVRTHYPAPSAPITPNSSSPPRPYHSRARNPRSPLASPSPSPICRGSGVGVPPPICRPGGSGVHPHPHPRFQVQVAGDRGSTPIPTGTVTGIPDLPGLGGPPPPPPPICRGSGIIPIPEEV